MTWAAVFERADEYETSVDEIRAALARQRGGDGSHGDSPDSTGEDPS